MVIQFTVQELMIFLICALGIAIGVLAVPILWHVKKTVVTLRSLVESNQESINQTIQSMPRILENAVQISCDVRETTDKLKVMVPTILGDVESATHNVKGNLELASSVIENVGSGITETVSAYKRETTGILNYFQIIEEILEIICRVLSPHK